MKQIMKFVKGLDPIADAFVTTGGTAGVTDVISMKEHKMCTFLIYCGVATGGTADGVVTVHACSTAAAAATTAIGFRYQTITTGDTPSAFTTASVTGFAMTPGSSQIYAIYVNASDLASTGYEFVRLTVTQDTNDPVVAGILAILTEPRYEQEVSNTAIV